MAFRCAFVAFVLWMAATVTALAAPDGERVGTWDPSAFAKEGIVEYIVNQESPLAKDQGPKKSKGQGKSTAGSYIFYLRRDGAILRIAQPNDISSPRGLRSEKGGSVIFADIGKPAIMRMNPDGKITTLVAGSLSGPRDVAVDAHGNFVIANFESFDNTKKMAVYRYDRSSKELKAVYQGKPLVWPHGIDVEQNGNYVIADVAGSVFRVTPSGQITTVAAGGPIIGPTDIKVQADGTYVVSDNQRGTNPHNPIPTPNVVTKLYRITPDGQITTIYQQPGAAFRAVANHPAGGWVVLSGVGTGLKSPLGPTSDNEGATGSDARGTEKNGTAKSEGAGYGSSYTGFLFRVYPDGKTQLIHAGAPFFQPAGVAILQ